MRQFRLVCTTYHMSASQEDGPGSLTNVDQTASTPTVSWSGECEAEPDVTYLHNQGVNFAPDPYGESEESYELQEMVSGKWRYCNGITPPDPQDDSYRDDEPESDDIDAELGRLHDTGFPKKPASILIGVRRTNLKHLAHAKKGDDVAVNAITSEGWRKIGGVAVAVRTFFQGQLISLEPNSESYLKPFDGLMGWKRIYLWIPRTGSCGILR